ncbi:Aste57867_3330 [Aphanomyces stellatus]|uniref:Aste57867_3330 protein n=1 Tax=Aphanomyces stellatus TaxID=120398 RepID=A0A485KEX8_9STRA|nr:hypothetical protein As57867_003320 [Aphanomyces stellatus]VFT80500.1 Aste57867_3330 [Aphanomyces stellatus]
MRVSLANKVTDHTHPLPLGPPVALPKALVGKVEAMALRLVDVDAKVDNVEIKVDRVLELEAKIDRLLQLEGKVDRVVQLVGQWHQVLTGAPSSSLSSASPVASASQATPGAPGIHSATTTTSATPGTPPACFATTGTISATTPVRAEKVAAVVYAHLSGMDSKDLRKVGQTYSDATPEEAIVSKRSRKAKQAKATSSSSSFAPKKPKTRQSTSKIDADDDFVYAGTQSRKQDNGEIIAIYCPRTDTQDCCKSDACDELLMSFGLERGVSCRNGHCLFLAMDSASKGITHSELTDQGWLYDDQAAQRIQTIIKSLHSNMRSTKMNHTWYDTVPWIVQHMKANPEDSHETAVDAFFMQRRMFTTNDECRFHSVSGKTILKADLQKGCTSCTQ